MFLPRRLEDSKLGNNAVSYQFLKSYEFQRLFKNSNKFYIEALSNPGFQAGASTTRFNGFSHAIYLSPIFKGMAKAIFIYSALPQLESWGYLLGYTLRLSNFKKSLS